MYQDTVDFFSGEDTNGPSAEAPRVAPVQSAQDANRPFPKLSAIPSGLAPDLQLRKYASAPVQRQGAPTQTLETELAAAVTPVPAPPPSVSTDRPAPPVQSAMTSGAVAPAPPSTPKPAVASAPLGGSAPPVPAEPQVAVVSPAPQESFSPAPQVPAPAMRPAYMTPGLSNFAPLPRGVGVREIFMARLNQRLPVKSQSAGVQAPAQQVATQQVAPQQGGGGGFKLKPFDNPGTPLTDVRPTPGAGFYDSSETVVISSSGVTNGASASGYAQADPDQMPQFSIDQSAGLPATGAYATPSMSSDWGGTKVATILFKNGSSWLAGKDKSVIKKVVEIYRQQGGRIRVVGHSSSRTRNMDSVQHKMINYRLSADRADSVATQLINLGVSSTDITVDAKSDSMPEYYETMPSGEAGNRRAEIFFE